MFTSRFAHCRFRAVGLLAGALLMLPAAAKQRPEGPRPGGSLRAPKSGLLLPPGSELLLDDVREVQMGHSPVVPGASGPVVRVAEGRVMGVLPLETVVDLYRLERILQPGQRPVFVAEGGPAAGAIPGFGAPGAVVGTLRLPGGGNPAVLVPGLGTADPIAPGNRPGGRGVPVDPRGGAGVRAPPQPRGIPGGVRVQPGVGPGAVAAPGPVERNVVYAVANPAGMLVLSTLLEGPAGPTRVRISLAPAGMPPDRALQMTRAVVDAIIGSGVNLAANPPPLPPGATPSSAVFHVPAAQLPELIKAVEQQLAPPVRNPLRAILLQASGVSMAEYRLPQPIPDAAFFQFYQQVARARGWQPVVENPVRGGSPSVIYQLPDRQGVISVHARPEMKPGEMLPGRGPARPGTILTVFQIQGDIDITRALRPELQQP